VSEKDPERLLKIIRQHLQPDQIVFVGVIDPINPAVETTEQVCERILLAAKHLPPSQLGTTDDCGGEMRTLLVPVGSRFFGARFDLMAGQYFDSYEYRILEAAGTPKSGQSVKAPAFNGTELQLAIPVSSLSPGEYIFVLLGRQQEKLVEISRAHLSIQR
jgi:hypothetical protein